VEWSDTMALDLPVLNARPLDEGWPGKLLIVLEMLGLTPTQDGPKWLVFPSYG
jgi:hypothetical protein